MSMFGLMHLFQPRLEHDRQCILVLMGADESGKKELGNRRWFSRERARWHELLVRLRDENGLQSNPSLRPAMATLGFWAAIRKI